MPKRSGGRRGPSGRAVSRIYVRDHPSVGGMRARCRPHRAPAVLLICFLSTSSPRSTEMVYCKGQGLPGRVWVSGAAEVVRIGPRNAQLPSRPLAPHLQNTITSSSPPAPPPARRSRTTRSPTQPTTPSAASSSPRASPSPSAFPSSCCQTSRRRRRPPRRPRAEPRRPPRP